MLSQILDCQFFILNTQILPITKYYQIIQNLNLLSYILIICAMPKFMTIKPQLEEDLKILIDKSEKVLQSAWFYIQNNSSSFEKSFHEWNGTSQKYCIQNYVLDKCLTKGVLLSNKSGIKFPQYEMVSQNENKMVILATTQLDKTFRTIKQKYLNKIQRLYIGLQSGFFRGFPGQQQTEFEKGKYDPRNRIWYVGGTTGSKRLLIAIDISKAFQPFWQQVKQRVELLIKTLNVNDYIGIIVYYENTAQILMYTTMQKAKFEIKKVFINLLQSIRLSQQTNNSNIKSLLTKIRSNFLYSIKQSSSNCNTTTNILILLHSSISNTTQNSDALSEFNSNIIDQNIFTFTYQLSNQTANLVKQQLNNIYSYHFDFTETNFANINFRKYEKIITHFINIDSPNWTEPYNDFETGKRMITVYSPIYLYSNGLRRIVGAGAFDVMMDNLESQQMSQKDVIENIVKCIPQKRVVVNENYVECLRTQTNNQSKCSFFKKTIIQSSNNISFEVLSGPVNTGVKAKNNICCGIQKYDFSIIISSILSVIILVIVLSIIYKWRKAIDIKSKIYSNHGYSQSQSLMGSNTLNNQSINGKKQIQCQLKEEEMRQV